MKGIYAITTLVVTLLIAIPFFKLPLGIATGGVVEGFYQGIIPIGYIVMMAVLLYKITQESGQFNTIQDSITSISQDQRIQLLLIGFSFNAFLEGLGFGVPIAICALLLAQLGFRPLQAAMLCLVANLCFRCFWCYRNSSRCCRYTTLTRWRSRNGRISNIYVNISNY